MMSLPTISPEFYVAAAPVLILSLGCIVAMLQSVSKNLRDDSAIAFTLFSMLGAALLAALATPASTASYLGGAYLAGGIVRLGQILILSISLMIALLSSQTFLRSHFLRGEITCLFQMTVLGMLVMIASDELSSLFIGLELSSLGIYTLLGYLNPSRQSQEGALKYFILGSFATAVLLFGFALLYVSTGSLHISTIMTALPSPPYSLWLKMGAVCTLVGFSFKLALAPFHLWSPDAYEAAPTNITAYMATCVKIMIMLAVLRFFSFGMPSLAAQWLPALMIMSVGSILFGNIMALVQTSLKRMLAYSSIAHSGYMAIALCTINHQDSLPLAAIIFYLAGYACTSLLAFGIIMWLEDSEHPNLNLDDISGLASKHPWAAFALASAMFSFAGLPPTVGFMGKFFIFNAALQQKFLTLVLVAVVGSAVALFYYLRVIVTMYMRERNVNVAPLQPQSSYLVATLMGLAFSAVLLLGTLFPGQAFEYIRPILELSLLGP